MSGGDSDLEDLSIQDVYGDIEGCPVGKRWEKREECSHDGVHRPLQAGISGRASAPAFSIVMSGGYEDDEDHGETFTYTGSGGRDRSGTRMQQLQGKKQFDGAQIADQKFERGNQALRLSHERGFPVRVVRGFNLESRFAPLVGYRYDGLYVVTKAQMEKGKKGFMMCKYEFKRVPGQPPLQTQTARNTLPSVPISPTTNNSSSSRAR